MSDITQPLWTECTMGWKREWNSHLFSN